MLLHSGQPFTTKYRGIRRSVAPCRRHACERAPREPYELITMWGFLSDGPVVAFETKGETREKKSARARVREKEKRDSALARRRHNEGTSRSAAQVRPGAVAFEHGPFMKTGECERTRVNESDVPLLRRSHTKFQTNSLELFRLVLIDSHLY